MVGSSGVLRLNSPPPLEPEPEVRENLPVEWRLDVVVLLWPLRRRSDEVERRVPRLKNPPPLDLRWLLSRSEEEREELRRRIPPWWRPRVVLGTGSTGAAAAEFLWPKRGIVVYGIDMDGEV